MSLRKYCDEIRNAVGKTEDYGLAESVDFREEIRAGKQAVISAEIRFVNGAVLIVREYIDAKYKLEKLRYAYQYHNSEGGLIFRAMIIVSANAQGKTATAGFSRVWLVAGGFIPRRRRPGMNPRPTS